MEVDTGAGVSLAPESMVASLLPVVVSLPPKIGLPGRSATYLTSGS